MTDAAGLPSEYSDGRPASSSDARPHHRSELATDRRNRTERCDDRVTLIGVGRAYSKYERARYHIYTIHIGASNGGWRLSGRSCGRARPNDAAAAPTADIHCFTETVTDQTIRPVLLDCMASSDIVVSGPVGGKPTSSVTQYTYIYTNTKRLRFRSTGYIDSPANVERRRLLAR